MRTNIKGTTINSLKYTGIVTISQCTGTKKTILSRSSNTGGISLFTYFADCLLGDFDVASLNRPTKIMLLNIDDSGIITKEQNATFITLLTKPEKVYSETEGIVRYSFIVPQDQIIGTNFNAVGLYAASATDADLYNYAACSRIVDLDRNSMALSSVLTLDWELHITNSTTK